MRVGKGGLEGLGVGGNRIEIFKKFNFFFFWEGGGVGGWWVKIGMRLEQNIVI